MARRKRVVAAIAIGGGVVVAAALVVAIVVATTPRGTALPSSSRSTSTPSASSSPTQSGPPVVPYLPLSVSQIAALPEAKYNGVIPGLIAYAASSVPSASLYADTISADTALYGSDRSTPVARLAATNFMELSTVVVPVETDGPWTLVLTPARQQLPSKSGGHAAAQTAGWLRTDQLHQDHAIPQQIVVSVSKQTISIVNADGSVAQSFAAGVGNASTPTPTGVVGYIQARYTDPAQGEAVYPIQLTSLHAAQADDPYVGHDGGLIGIHYNIQSNGTVSHGCVRLAVPAITAITALPLGTLVTIDN